jgi:hypothetical protein
MRSHSRSEGRVGAWDWYSVAASHASTAVHCLFVVAASAADLNSSHAKSADGSLSALAMKNPVSHWIHFVQLRSEYRVARVDS